MCYAVCVKEVARAVAKGKYENWLTPDGLLLLEGWARDGLTLEQIAHNCGCSRETLNEWKKRFPSISDALKKGREVVDYEVENALLKRALGYEYQETRVEVNEKDGRKVIETTKQMPPDTGAAVFWLKNKRRDRWRDRWPDAPAERDEVQTGCVLLPEAETGAADAPDEDSEAPGEEAGGDG